MNVSTPSKALQTLRAGASALLPIYPETFEDVVRLARMAIISGMIKPLTKGWGENQETEPPDATEARATMIVMGGMEIGLPPMQSIQLLAMINGRITAHSEAVPGILWSKGFKIKDSWSGTEMSDDWTATCTLTRPDGDVIIRSFSVIKAKQARLWSPELKIKKRGKGGVFYDADNDEAWHKYPDRMLWARALGFAAKDGAADAMRGLMVREEVEDMIRSGQIVDITPNVRPAIATSSADIPDVPDVPEAAPEPVIDQTSVDDEKLMPEQELAVLEHMQASLAEAKNAAEHQEIADSFLDVIERMGDESRRKAERLIEGRS